jgi:hypothetical protein
MSNPGKPSCLFCMKAPAERVITYPFFLMICTLCFMSYSKTHDEIEWQTYEAYERSLQ